MPIEVTMPALSPTMTEGTLAKWVKKEGDNVAPGDVLAEIETDKATMEVEAVDEGVVGKILVPAGTKNVKVNEVIALLLAEGEKKDVLNAYKPKKAANEKPKETEEQHNTKISDTSSPSVHTNHAGPAIGLTPPPVVPIAKNAAKSLAPKNNGIAASPLARRIAQDAGVNISRLIGSGPGGRVVKEDVDFAIRTGITQGRGGVVERSSNEQILIENNMMRQTIATRLLQSKQHVPHFYLSVDCELDKLLALRTELNDYSPAIEGKPAYKISVNDMVIKAAALALKEVPGANASWTTDAIVQYTNIDISVAVAIEGGLITPIIRNADQKSVQAISIEMKKLAEKARKGTLALEEFQGGGFSISNLGMYGIKEFQAIINPPQSCILAVGAGEQRAVVKNGKLEIATIMTVSISCDHRVVDGAMGAELLTAFKRYIERPVGLIL